MKMGKEKTGELENRTVGITKSEQQRENGLKRKMNRTSGIYETITKYYIQYSCHWSPRRN